MKKLALISSYCDTEEKLSALRANIQTVKSLGVDVLLLSPIPIPQDVINSCDYYFQTKDNPILNWPLRAIEAWVAREVDQKVFTLATCIPDHGYAGLFQTKKLSEIGSTLDYDYFYHMIYDLKIDSNVIDGFQSEHARLIYPSTNGQTIWPAGLHFMIFDKPSLIEFASKITLSDYISSSADAFGWLNNLKNRFLYDSATIPVEDSINYYKGSDLFNSNSIDDTFKLFIAKNSEDKSNITLLFYEGDLTNLSIKVFVDDLCIAEDVKLFEPIDLGFNEYSYKKTIIQANSKIYDMTSKIIDLKNSTLTVITKK